MTLNAPCPTKTVSQFQATIGFTLPKDYIEFVLHANGGSGPVGEYSHLVLWRVEDILPWNEGYSVSELAPGLVLFGSDGGDTAYAFLRWAVTIVIPKRLLRSTTTL